MEDWFFNECAFLAQDCVYKLNYKKLYTDKVCLGMLEPIVKASTIMCDQNPYVGKRCHCDN